MFFFGIVGKVGLVTVACGSLAACAQQEEPIPKEILYGAAALGVVAIIADNNSSSGSSGPSID